MKRTARRIIIVWILFLNPLFCGAQEAAVSMPAAVSPENNVKNALPNEEAAKNSSANKIDAEESAVQKPKWLEQAEKAYAEGVRAREAGDIQTAGKKFSQCLKIIGDKADQECRIQLKEEIGSFFEALAKVQEWNPAPELIRYRVTRGDYLGRIASKFDTTVQGITEQNKIRNTRTLRENQILIIRPGRKYRG